MVKAPTANIRPVLLAIVKLVVEMNNSAQTTFAILDQGSEATLISRKLANLLKLKGPSASICFGSFNNSVLMDSNIVAFKLKSIDGSQAFDVREAFVVPSINLSQRKINWRGIKKRWEHLADIDLPAIDSSKVEILVGMDMLPALRTLNTAAPNDGETGPTALQTCFGWAVVGKIPLCLVAGPSNKSSVNLGFVRQEPFLSEVVDRFHLTETFGVVAKTAKTNPAANEDEQMLSILQRSIKFIGCGYQVELPLRQDRPVIPNNRGQAVSRFCGLERRMLEPHMRETAAKYVTIVENLISSGTVVAVNWSDINKPEGMVWYLPHFYVVNPNKPEKIRVVFDCAALYRGVSLNHYLLRGPPFIPSLVGILLRARQFLVALTADITAFYHRVGVAEKHQSLQRFVYREFGSNAPITTYQFATLVFGAVCSSSAAIFTLQHAVNANVQFPQVADKLKDNFYSDNLSDSFETNDEAINFAKQVTQSLASAGFSLTSFASSSRQVLATIPENQRTSNTVDLNKDALPVEYLLGMVWDLNSDSYGIRIKSMPTVTTKRELLSAISLTFDPLGICLPAITGAKLLFQQTQKLAKDTPDVRGWDQPLSIEILSKWKQWTSSLEKLRLVSVKRCFRPANFPLVGSDFVLVIFADASPVAFGAVAYLRVRFGDKIHVSFVMAKGRLAPLKPTTIPRLELKAAVLAVNLSLIVKQELRLSFSSVEFHTDSQIVLYQLRASHPGRPSFVNKRTNEILQHSTVDQWHYIRSSDNPADDCTRGIVPKDFGPNCRWIRGPDVLFNVSYTPPPFDQQSIKAKENEEIQAVNVQQLHVAISSCHPLSSALSKLITRSIQLNTLKREAALRLRGDSTSNDDLNSDEITEAFRICLLVSQQDAFSRERAAFQKGKMIPRDSVLRRVGPYLDPDDGLLEVDGRLGHAVMPARTRNPIIIAPDHPLTRLIISDRHLQLLHSGVEHTLSVVREQFYLPQGRRAIRRTLAQRTKCKMLRAMPQAPRMASLPKERLVPSLRVFTNVGLDCFGPFQVVIGRRSVKRWGLLITCLSTRAVHLEVLDTMDADSFIMALRRFISL
ncbi:uncharacterized protein LOC116923312 [Daphnia magna]|uniref:uncharacterized protein LOC116923312 n=1 Tax=Daphnia magna TaxID=35525 RepID=UPI001E1BD395|nr:uncharacterized protein LOC116923312 [Daphnia magna]